MQTVCNTPAQFCLCCCFKSCMRLFPQMISKNNIEELNWIDFYKDMNSFDSGQFEMIKSQISNIFYYIRYNILSNKKTRSESATADPEPGVKKTRSG